MMQYRSILEWKYKTYKGVWDAQTQRRERMNRTKLEEAIRQQKQMQMEMNAKMKIDENKKIDKKMKNMKAIIIEKGMIANKKPMKKTADGDKEVTWKTSKSKSKDKGKRKKEKQKVEQKEVGEPQGKKKQREAP